MRKRAFVVTATFTAIGLALLVFRPLNQSIEFTGGTLLQLHVNDASIETGRIRAALEAGGISGAEIQTFGAPDEFVIRARLDPRLDVTGQSTQATSALVDSALTSAFSAGSYDIERVEAVGPKVGGELRQKALLAILMSFGATLIYLWFRFEWRFGIAAVAATVHDIISTIAFVSLMNLEITLVIVAALLTIVGYSLNDTIITFDRVRENLRKFKRKNLLEILNRSVNETLPRTVLTSGTTLAATLALLIFGGEVIRGFAWVMTWGVVTGTFSSIFIASPILLAIERRWPGEDIRGVRAMPETGAVVTS
jgi:preprotein translocase subunit SecF